jgi:hypothetical protein
MDTSITIRPLPPQFPTQSQRRIDGTSAAEDKAGRTPAEPAQALNPGDLRVVQQLKQRDREVRSHELAHKAIAGQYARGAPSYEYRIGPDGKRYAVGGEVSIDMSKSNDPRETLRKAEVIRRAAMAPAHPSMQDRQIAQQASAMAAEARHELLTRAEQDEAAVAQAGAGRQNTAAGSESGGTTLNPGHTLVRIYRAFSSGQDSLHTPFELIA